MMLFVISYLIFLPLCWGLFVEINFLEKNESRSSRSIKLVCVPPNANIYPKKNDKLLWKGSNFGEEEQQKLAEIVDSGTHLPLISINTSKNHGCYIVAPKNVYKQWAKKRVVRNDFVESIASERGVCPPGYRMKADRCFPCIPGSYTSGASTKCFPCPKNFFSARKAADSCWPCPGDKKTLAEGADSENACFSFDEKGNPIIKENPSFILIFSLIGGFSACVWVILVYLLIRYWKEKKSGPVKNAEAVTSKSDDHFYQSISDTSSYDSDGHTYAEIGDFDGYEEPLKRQAPIYGNITTHVRKQDKSGKNLKRSLPSLPGSKSDLQDVLDRISSRSDIYESPKRKNNENDDNLYETPIQLNMTYEGNKEKTNKDENIDDETNLCKTQSTGFNSPNAMSTYLITETTIRIKPGSANAVDDIHQSAHTEKSKKGKQRSLTVRKTKSTDKMDKIPEEQFFNVQLTPEERNNK